jgi:hypothetical protein
MLIGDVRALELIAPDTASLRHSFAAAALCVPAAAAVRWIDWRSHGVPAPLWHAIGVDLAAYPIGWAGFLLICRPLLQAMGQPGAWPRLVTVWNWCNVAQYAVMLAGTVFELFDASNFVLNVVGLVTLFWGCWIEFRVLRPILAGRAPVAGAIVALDVVIGISLQLVTAALGG